jgi:outer membrane protein OmpA-like peptidoglycan-associated protein
MSTGWRTIIAGFVLVGLLGLPGMAEAQFGKLKDKIKEKTEEKVEEKVDETIDETLEGQAEEEEQAKETESTAAETDTESGGQAATTTSAEKLAPGEGAWANYDFVPGDKVLYYEDFEKSPVGDFPERLEFEEGNMEVVEWQNRRFLRMSTNADFNVPLPQVLPERFTLEFDLYLPSGVLKIYGPADDGKSSSAHSYIQIGHGEGGIRGSGGGEAQMDIGDEPWEDIVQVRIMGYKKYLKVYLNETRVANVPNADFVRTDRIHFYLYNFSQDGVLIDHLRVAEGGKKILYDALEAEGRVATRGIYFDSGSDRIRPESTPTLKQIGQMLQEHAELKLMIEGHTDSQGEDAYNLNLSDKRAAAVKAYLVKKYDIDEARLQTKGFGENNPCDTNNTPEGRQNNRRVELVKL